MPTPKRWFPKSRDFNDDPEGWELTDTFGDRTVRLWDEICAMLDKTDNHWRVTGQWLASLSRKVRQSSATVSRAIDWMVAKHWLTVEEVSADGLPMVFSAPNYWNYHKRRESKGGNHGTNGETKRGQATLPPNLPYPNLPIKSPAHGAGPVKNQEENITNRFAPLLARAVKLGGDDFAAQHKLSQWVISMARCLKSEPQERTLAVVEASLKKIEDKIAGGYEITSIWGLLTVVFDAERTKYIQGPENEGHKHAPVPTALRDLIRNIG